MGTLGLALLIAYLLGSIPFGLLLTKAAGIGDIRQSGSGNIGATNVARVGGKKLGIAVLLLDMSKGALAIMLASYLFRDGIGTDPVMMMLLYTVVLAHIFPVWLKFKGGKGVATVFGALLALHWQLGAVFTAVWLTVFFATRYVSLASIVAITAVAGFAGLLFGLAGLYAFAPLALLLIFTHRANIKRLLNGTEHRFGRKAG